MVTLKDLQIGDSFYPASRVGKSTPIFEVLGNPEFNPRHGTPTRICINRKSNERVSKSCRLRVVKINKENSL